MAKANAPANLDQRPQSVRSAMIIASVTMLGPDGFLGHYRFDALPRKTDRLQLSDESFEVVSVEHFPELADRAPREESPKTRIWVRQIK